LERVAGRSGAELLLGKHGGEGEGAKTAEGVGEELAAVTGDTDVLRHGRWAP
jgi:hypothetical protein